MDDESLSYAKQHKLDFWEMLVKDSPVNQRQKAIFMAGTPGAGKTEVAEEFAKLGTGLVRLDADWFRQYFPGYTGQNAADFQRGSAWLVDWCFTRLIKKHYSFILDGTFAFSRATMNIQRALDHDYDTTIYFVSQDPVVAWDFTKARAIKAGRVVPKERFINAYDKSQTNVAEAKRLFGDKIELSLILKNYQDDIEDIVEDVENIDLILPTLFSKTELEARLND
ncbi:zeta toxin family protein [Lactiplantibacillus pentosus]|uniref:zeta toxin family protein n=1 Tax=Lactiplantibacillus pentosus TaxID=1589 RepID=UPI000D020331|nr:zeta toxin family protein [Lactiplantibacillus pentosus]MCT3284465.1 zeta toxin family protein [Lactiplantibacillus pentosus]MCT3303112.1 zeta toxin family protein [Lactiplantibacillus pentosus]PRO76756.1 zeta toxin family protein [Lactiplantibacillus pentosus]PRO78662.1 zeta toxin family protein [Lactiplantibacillus pentosus]PRO87872.1 zeta toxin family protein [Lactiplantibacillus pentosus]